MKLQGLAVLFAVILLPIVVVTSSYIQTQIDTVVLEQRYDSILMNATHDAIKAFQLNEINSNTDNIVSEKMRDIEASISTFYNSLGTGMGSSGYSEDDLKPYVPALVYNLYDGYYIYAPYRNIKTGKQEWGLKPYIYYSAHYVKNEVDVTISYTLDNYITVYGKLRNPDNGKVEYVSREGYLINPNEWNGTTYKGIEIKAGEQLIEVNELQAQNALKAGSVSTAIPYNYIEGENGRREKVYLDEKGWYKYTVDKQRKSLTEEEINNFGGEKINKDAREYYKNAAEFSNWIERALGKLTIKDMKVTESEKEFITDDFFEGKGDIKIFDLENDPESETSNFYNHKKDVIRNSIESNLAAVIAAYNQSRDYNFKMPVLSEQDWDKITNHVSMISFMQGLPIKNKYYMGYTVVSNNMNREFVDPDSIYIVGEDNSYHSIYHNFNPTGNCIGYRNLEFEQRSFMLGNQVKYYLPHAEQGDYDCIVSSNAIDKDKEGLKNESIASAYYTALARERYNSYKSTKNFLAMLPNSP